MSKSLVVNQSNDLVMAQYAMPLNAKKLFAMSIAKLNPVGRVLKSKFNLRDLSELIDTDDPNVIARLSQAAIDVSNITIQFHQEGKDITCWAFSQFSIDPKTKDIEILFPPALKPHLLDLQKQYSSYLIQNIAHLSNPLHIRLFEILRSKAKMGNWTCQLNELFSILLLPSSYNNYSNLEKYFLAPARNVLLQETSLYYDYEPIKTGRKVTKIKFHSLKYQEKAQIETSAPTREEITPVLDTDKPKLKKDVIDKQVKEIFNYYLESWGYDTRVCSLTDKRKAKICARLKKFSVADLKTVVDTSVADPWEERRNNNDPELLFRSVEKVEEWLKKAKQPEFKNKKKKIKDDIEETLEYKEEYDKLITLNAEPVYAIYKAKEYARERRKLQHV